MKDLSLNARHARLFAAITLTLALAACQKLGGIASSGGDKASNLTVGETVSGEITSSSTLNYNDGSRHQGYKITMKNGEAVSLELGGSLSGQLAVFDGQNMIANASSSGTSEGDSSSSVNLAFRAPKDGTYLVAVNSASADAFGPFKLKSWKPGSALTAEVVFLPFIVFAVLLFLGGIIYLFARETKGTSLEDI